MTEQTDNYNDSIQVILQAGGKGERLRLLTQNLPKTLVRVNGITLLNRLLAQMFDSGFVKVTVIAGWQGDKLVEYVDTTRSTYANLEIDVISEPRRMGNIGAIRLIKSDGLFLFIFADLITNLDFRKLVTDHRQSDADITIACHYHKYRVEFGEVAVDSGKVIEYTEKPEKSVLVCSGICVINPDTVAIIPPDEVTGISDFINLALQQGYNVRYWMHNYDWIDVNNSDSLRNAEIVFNNNN